MDPEAPSASLPIRTHGVLNVVAVAVPISLTWAFES